jgi:hypothetical protein
MYTRSEIMSCDCQKVSGTIEQVSDLSTVQVNEGGKIFLYVPTGAKKAAPFNLEKGSTVRVTVMSDGELRVRRVE